MINPAIFREYDIRGLADTDLDDDNVLDFLLGLHNGVYSACDACLAISHASFSVLEYVESNASTDTEFDCESAYLASAWAIDAFFYLKDFPRILRIINYGKMLITE